MKILILIVFFVILASLIYAYVMSIQSLYEDEREHMIQTKIRRERMANTERNRDEWY